MFCRTGLTAAAIVVAVLAGGCGDSSEPSSSSSGGDSPAPVKAEGGYIVGRVLGQDGKPIAVASDIAINVYGVSEAGERVQYSPAVKADGTYKQKLVPGAFRAGRSLVKVRHGEHEFDYELTPQGNLWNKDRDSAEGIEQDFVWNMTGQRTSDKPDLNNHTHWYGMNMGVSFSIWRDDLKKASARPVDGTTFVFTLKPQSKLVNGEDGKELTIERAWRGNDITPIDDLNDLPPASYEITAIAKLPDGTTKPVLLQGAGDYPNYKPSAKAPLAKDSIIGGMAKWEISFVLAE